MNPILNGSQRRGVTWVVCGVLVGTGLSGGCETVMQTVLPKPALEPVPTEVPTPKPDLFDPKAGVIEDPTKVVSLNDNDPANPKLPDKFRVTAVNSGELLMLQSVTTTKRGNPAQDVKVYGPSDVARLFGIITPQPGQPGHADVVARVNRWTLGQEVDVQQDARFPVDFNNRRMVQVFFNRREGTPQEIGQRVLLNRMLVRMGYAVVDINSTASVDIKPWLDDEQFARNKRLGLWGKGIILGQRIRIPAPSIPGTTTSGARSGANTSQVGVGTRNQVETRGESSRSGNIDVSASGTMAPPTGASPTGASPATSASPAAP